MDAGSVQWFLCRGLPFGPSRYHSFTLVPNLITLLRLALVPVMAWTLARHRFDIAAVIFLLVAVSDWADGFIARRFRQTSRVGAALDPVADKLSMFVATLILAFQHLLPVWLAAAIIARDVNTGEMVWAFRVVVGSIEFTPTWLSKVNTALEFALLLAVMAGAAEWIPTGRWEMPSFVIVFASVVASGVQYVWAWGAKALRKRRSRS